VITLINLHLQNASSLFVSNGSIVLQLNVDSTVIASPFGFVSADIPIVFQLDANGDLIQPAKIYSNAELFPQLSPTLLGTYYLVTFYTQAGARVSQPMWWQFPESSGATVDISNMIPVSQVGGVVIFYPVFSGGSGSVTSVTFTGDGTILSSTPSAPVTTTGTLLATLKTQPAGTIFAGPATGGPALPTFRAIVASDLPAGITSWSNLTNATANLTLANAGFSTTFDQTTTVPWLWANTALSTGFAFQQNSPTINIAGTYWTGAVSAPDTWTIQDVLTDDPLHLVSLSALKITHIGTPTVAQVLFPDGSIVGGVVFPGISFNNDRTSGLFNLGSAQMTLAAGGVTVATISGNGNGSVDMGNLVPIVGFGDQGLLYFSVLPSAQSAVSFNIPPGAAGSPSMTAIILTQLAADPTTSSFGTAQKGAVWFNTTSNLIKYWDGAAIRSVNFT
jgi:hypothetical protein